MTKRYIGLLRGINVGGKNRLPMARLREIFADCGAEEITTYIQSGNVVFTSSAKAAASILEQVSERLAAELGLRIPIVLRSADELRRALDAHPFEDRGVPEKFRSIMFLERKPTAAQRRSLDPECVAGEEWEVIGGEVHLCYPAGSARSKLTNTLFDRRLETISTTRNLRTVRKLIELAGSRP
jgi:uncharacterized protein (DUF1697 family)